MLVFNCVFLILLELVLPMRVLCNLHETIHAMTENNNNTDLKTFKKMWKTYDDGKQNLALRGEGKQIFNFGAYHAQYSSLPSHKNTSDEKIVLSLGNENNIRNPKRIRIKLNTNNIANSKKNVLLKRKKELIDHAKNFKQNLRRLHSEQSLTSDDINNIKYDMYYNNLDFGKLSPKILKKRTPLSRLQLGNDLSINTLHINGETRDLNSGKIYNSLNQEHPINCTKENNWCQSFETHDNRRKNLIMFDLKSKASLNEPMNISHSDFGRALAVKDLYFNNSDKFPDVVKERDMLDKFLNFGDSDKTSQYETGEKKKGPLKAIADKLKYVFPFLKGFGLGVKKEFKKPRSKVPNPHHTFKYDPHLGMFYTTSQTSKPLFNPNPILFGSKRPISLSDLLKSNTKLKGIPVPYNVEVEKRIPYFIKVPYDNPVPVHISEPYGVPVEKIVPYPVRVEVPEPYPVTKIIKKPYNLYVENPVPVEVDQPYPVLKEQVKPYSVETVVNKPYLHPEYEDFAVALPYDKNIPYPVTVDNKHEHQNKLTDELENTQLQLSNETIATDNQLTRSVPLSPLAYIGAQRHPVNHLCNSAYLKPYINPHKFPHYYNTPHYYYNTDNRLPKTTKLKQSRVPTTYAEALKAIMKIRGNGITEVKFLDLMKQGQKKGKMKQSQLLHQALQRTLLHRHQLIALMKQNQMLKASLAQEQNKTNPNYQTKEVFPEFKPLNTNIELPLLQNNKFNNNNSKPHSNLWAEYFNPKVEPQNSNYQYSHLDSHKNIAQTPKSQQEIIDEHLRQLYNENKNKDVQVQESDSNSYKLPDGPSLSSYYNQGDSDSEYSMQQNIFKASPNVSLQDNDLYRLQLEYKILDNLMKNINVIKNNADQSTPTTSGYDESLVTKFDPKNIQMIKFSPNESVPSIQTPFYNSKNAFNNVKATTEANFQSNFAEDVDFIKENGKLVHTERYNNPNSWANLNQVNHVDNYTKYLANVIKDSYLKNHSNYGHNEEEEKIQPVILKNVDTSFSSGSNSAPVSRPNSNSFQTIVNIGNRHKSRVTIKDMSLPSDSPLHVDKNKVYYEDRKNIIQDVIKNGLGTYKPIYNSDVKYSNNHDFDGKVATFPSKAIEYEVVSNEKHKKTAFGHKRPTNNNAYSEVKVAHIPSKSIPFQVTKNENHKKAVAFGIDADQDGYEKKTERPYDFEIGNDDEPLYGDGSEDYVSYESKTNAEPVETAKSRTEDDKYENYRGYYKKPLNKWIFNNTEEFKGNSAINFGKLNDFLDIVKQNRPQDESEAEKKVTAEKLNNAIFGDVQKHFDTPTDMNAEGSYTIESKTRNDDLPKKNTNDLDFSDVVFKNKIKPDRNTVDLNTEDNKVESDQPVRIALFSTDMPTTVDSKTKEVETIKTRGSTKAQKNETLNNMQTTISEYSNIRRGKDIVSNKTNTGNEGAVMTQVKNENMPGINSSSKIDFKNRTQLVKGNTHKNSAKQVMKESYIKDDEELNSKISSFEKVAIITPENVSSGNYKYEKHTDQSHQNEPELQIFDLFNTLDSFMSTKQNNIDLNNKDFNEKSTTENTKLTSTTALPTITTSSTLFNTLPTTFNTISSTISSKIKPLRDRGSIRASSSISGKSEKMKMRVRNSAFDFDETTTESMPNNKNRRRQEKGKPFSEEETTTINSHLSSIKNNVKNETKNSGSHTDEKENVKIRNTNTETPVQNKSALYEDSKKLRNFNATHKPYQKDTNEFRTVRIFPLDENTENTVTSSVPLAADRVTVKTIQQIERVKIRNKIKEKIENSTKKSVSKMYDYRNSSDILERRQKNRERFMFGFMMTTSETPVAGTST